MDKQDYQITAWCRRMMRDHISEGAFCIDATMGNGNDTEYLCRLAGPTGRVLAFDVQQQALDATRRRLQESLPWCNYELILDSHSHMEQYAGPESADCIAFNLGYLPGGDHGLATKPETTIEALSQGLSILKKNGIMSVCIYSGGDSGFEEKEAVLSWMKGLDCSRYLVLVTQYYNRPNHPPVPAAIIRLR
ncbi:MAG: class I SAM-dependent methyltransferase [Candidatus Choladocola sp.]|nr:class I SAM-dependent methyltransferase [Candidatus Choladocola sp.]